ncbi:MAG: helix-turn-helix domain-containing protein [Acidobacteria bacterium]|nr:helix-turn-helix domain-containing protein [Acidobacteriota bacterium]
MHAHKLLDGRTLRLGELSRSELDFLATLRRMTTEGVSFFEIERFAIGPGSPALRGRSTVNASVVESALYLAARDIATRAGIEQKLILAPEHERERRSIPADGSLISVTQAANLVGMTRQAVHQAINSKKLIIHHYGNVILVERASAEAFKESRKSGATSRAQSAGPSRAPLRLAAKG